MCLLRVRPIFILVYAYLLVMMSACTSNHDGSRTAVQKETTTSEQGGSSPQKRAAAAVTVPITVATDLKIQREEGQNHILQTNVVFSTSGRGVAYVAEKNGTEYVVHNGIRGYPGTEISNLVISPDGQRIAYRKFLGEYRVMVVDGVASKTYKTVFAAVYSPDSRHVAYLAVEAGGLTYVVLDGKQIDGVVEIVSAEFLFSHDSKTLVYHVRPNGGTDGYFVLYDIKTGKKSAKACLDTAIIMNNKKDHIAAVVKDGAKQRVAVFAVSTPETNENSGSYDKIQDLSFGVNGESLAFVGAKGTNKYIVVNGREELLPAHLGISAPAIIRPDGRGAGIILESHDRYDRYYVFHQTGQKESADKRYSFVKDPVYGSTGSVVFVARVDEKYCVIINGKEGPHFDSAIGPLFTPDGSMLVYRARDGNKRMVVVADFEGKEHKRHQGYEMVFPVAIQSDGKSISYGVKEGDRLIWKVERL